MPGGRLTEYPNCAINGADEVVGGKNLPTTSFVIFTRAVISLNNCFNPEGQDALQDVPVSYVEAVPISVRSIVNKTEDQCRGMSGGSDKVRLYGGASDTPNTYAMSKQSADSASVTLTGGAAGDTNGMTTAPYPGTPNGSGSGSGTEIPDFQFEDPDLKLLISDPEHCWIRIRIRNYYQPRICFGSA